MDIIVTLAISIAALSLAVWLGTLTYSYVLQIRNLMEEGKFLRERAAAVPGGELRWRKAFDDLLVLGVESIEKFVKDGKELIED